MSDFLSSWSRRRAAVAAEEQALERAKESELLEEQHHALSELPEDELLEKLGLPNPDTLVKGDDFKAFMAKSVPAHLRKRALRQLWRSDPVLACVDGLNDYDDDYLTQSLGQTALKTTYQVGKGLMAHLLEQDRPKATPAAKVEVEAEHIRPDPALPPPETALAAEDDQQACTETPVDPPLPVPRRMQFYFEDDAL